MDLLALTYEQLLDCFKSRYNRAGYHAAALYKAFYRSADFPLHGLPAFEASTGLADQVARDLDHQRPRLVRARHHQGVEKLVFALADGLRIETVIIPMANHVSVCVSCQAGCRMGCRFCQTGQMGLQRQLAVSEIVWQVYYAKVQMGCNVRNVVFMGMGEPLDNFEPVMQAVRVMADQRGLNIAERRITVSTAGLADGIERLAAMNRPQLRLAVSLNAPSDAVRDTIMPINRRYPMARLKRALQTVPLARGNAFFVEYVLIKGVNDSPRHAVQLAEYLKDIPAKLNLIAYNPRRGSPFQAPGVPALARFQQALVDRKIFVRVRSSKGASIRAACGQLGGRSTVSDQANHGRMEKIQAG
jgi:23S rRNA (adenine2503-C2)-methyltransferase